MALQTTGDSRLVAAAGSIANVLIGGLSLALFHWQGRFSPRAYFFWLFGSLNLLNGSGYPLYSAVLGSGDWEVVARGLEPASMWRIGLGLIGTAAYAIAIMLSARELTRSVRRGLVSLREIPRLVFPAYVAGGTLLLAASAFNPIGPRLILVSGVSSGFAAMAGLTLVPRMVEARGVDIAAAEKGLSSSVGWILAGLVIGSVFVAMVGPGIQFRATP